MSAYPLERGLELSVAVDAHDRRVRGPMERFDDAREDAARARTHQRAGTRELEQEISSTSPRHLLFAQRPR